MLGGVDALALLLAVEILVAGALPPLLVGGAWRPCLVAAAAGFRRRHCEIVFPLGVAKVGILQHRRRALPPPRPAYPSLHVIGVDALYNHASDVLWLVANIRDVAEVVA